VRKERAAEEHKKNPEESRSPSGGVNVRNFILRNLEK